MAAKKPFVPKPKSGQPPPVDKLIKPAIFVALAMVVYQFFRGIGAEVCSGSRAVVSYDDVCHGVSK
jgi:hypothetical protein